MIRSLVQPFFGVSGYFRPPSGIQPMIRSLVSLFAALLVTAAIAGGPVSWTFTQATAADGSTVVQLKAVCEEGWHIYALTLPRDDGPFPTVIRLTNDPAFEMNAIREPEAEEVDDTNFGMKVRYHSGSPVFEVVVKRTTNEAFTVNGEVEFMCCNDRMCLPPNVVPFSVQIPAVK
jgi:hypothetical protein